MMSGIYALIDLARGPLDPRDLAALGLANSAVKDVAIKAVDGIAPRLGRVLAERGRSTAFMGRLDEPEEIADRLGVARSTPHPVLARVALDRFGASMPAELLGGWIMLDRTAAGIIRVLAGFGGRAPMLYALSGNQLAIAPSIHALSQLRWVGRTLDDEGFLLSLTNVTPGEACRTRTILRTVRKVPRGGCLTIAPDREPRLDMNDPFIAMPRWAGDRQDAMAAAEDLLRRIVRQQLAHTSSPGLMLSGGLDSSLVAWALKAEGADALPALSSAVTAGRGVADETRFAAIVARALGLPLHHVVPPLDVNIYRPSEATLAASNFPPLSPRDYVYSAFADAASDLGVSELFDGAHGELTFTALMPIWSWRNAPYLLASRARDKAFERASRWSDPMSSFLNAALAPHRLDRMAPLLARAMGNEPEEAQTRRPGDRWDYSTGARPPLRRDATELRSGRLRLIRPFHDIRLLRLFAGFPASYMVSERGMTRWPARAVLSGRLPDAITMRQSGMPFSPDYELRLSEQARPAMDRVAHFRAADCGDWFDLEWLNEGLGRIVAGQKRSLSEIFRIQLTAHACEFLAWWRRG